MRIRFTEQPPGRDYKVGAEVEFRGFVEESYARKFISRGWAVDVADDPKPEPVKAEEPKPEPVKEVKADHHGKTVHGHHSTHSSRAGSSKSE